MNRPQVQGVAVYGIVWHGIFHCVGSYVIVFRFASLCSIVFHFVVIVFRCASLCLIVFHCIVILFHFVTLCLSVFECVSMCCILYGHLMNRPQDLRQFKRSCSSLPTCVYMCMCKCVCVRERDREKVCVCE